MFFGVALNITNHQDLVKELAKICCDPAGIKIMANKRSGFCLKVFDIPGYMARIIKEECLSNGADCALPKESLLNPQEKIDILLLGTRQQISKVAGKLAIQGFSELRGFAEQLTGLTSEPDNFYSPRIMGILNVTPDSFSDGNKFSSLSKAVNQATTMIKEGATIIDIGGESTRPGAEEVDEATELARVIPVVQELHKLFPHIEISVDTTKYRVAQEALNQGASIINDISGLNKDSRLAQLIANKPASKLVIMHSIESPKTMQDNPQYQDLLKEVLAALKNSINIAKANGVADQQIIIDPGIGFGKTTADNIYLIKQLHAIRSLGYPVLLGASRKSVIGNTLELPVDERLAGTIATSLMGQLNQVDYVRVHDVAANKQALNMFEALLNG